MKVAASTAWEILENAGIDPAPRRTGPPPWSQLLRSQAEAILACDFFTAGLLDGTQAYVLAVIEHATIAWSALVKNSARIVLCRRSTFPVVVGEYGALSNCVILYPRRSGRK